MKHHKLQIIALLLLTTLANSAKAQTGEIQPLSGGNFTMTKSVIGGGGGELQNGSFNIQATPGQSITGLQSEGQFLIQNGFWTTDSLVRIHSTETVSVFLLNKEGKGLSSKKLINY